ncbi:MAG: alkaline phosphatase D family protein [Planctomycetota bacterium]|jgi:alkaline phosphatase D
MLTHLHLLTLLISPAQSPAAPTESTLEPLERIAVGSCFRERGDAAIWDTITEADPDLLLLIGDNVYADSDDPAELEAAWKRLDAAPAFRTLKESRPLIAVWDDHDYGRNDAGREYPVRVESQRVFLDWLGVPADSPRREREGVHDARTFGPIGRRVQILTLDTRYHRTPLTRRTGAWPEGVTGPYMPGDDSDGILLGEAQWTWLEEQLREPADVRIIASSIQFAADPHGGETWSNFPHELERMHRTLARTGANGVVFVSGDRHAGEISVRPTAHDGLDAGYDLFDLTASALNQPRGWAPERNDARLGDLWFDTNFGLIEIDWEASPPTVSDPTRPASRPSRCSPAVRGDTGTSRADRVRFLQQPVQSHPALERRGGERSGPVPVPRRQRLRRHRGHAVPRRAVPASRGTAGIRPGTTTTSGATTPAPTTR